VRGLSAGVCEDADVTPAHGLTLNSDMRSTADERGRYGFIQEQNKLLVNKVRDYRANAPQLSSRRVDWTEYQSDYDMRAFYEGVATRLQSLLTDRVRENAR
jgi:hypothetical protein